MYNPAFVSGEGSVFKFLLWERYSNFETTKTS